jgi:hypothetical protein
MSSLDNLTRPHPSIHEHNIPPKMVRSVSSLYPSLQLSQQVIIVKSMIFGVFATFVVFISLGVLAWRYFESRGLRNGNLDNGRKKRVDEGRRNSEEEDTGVLGR